MARRARGEGAVWQRHDHPFCPPPVDGTRPDHRCRGRWTGQIDLGWSAGKRVRKTVYGTTRKSVTDQFAELRRKYPTEKSASNWTVAQWMHHWLTEIAPARASKPQTRRGYKSKIDTYIVPLIGRHKLIALEPHHVRSMYQRLRMACPDPTDVCRHKHRHDGPCPDPAQECRHEPRHARAELSIRQTHMILRRALVVAQQEGYVERNVATLVDPPGTKVKNPRIPLSLDQARTVLAAASQGADRSLELRVFLRLYYGLRTGEVLGIGWSDVDMMSSEFHVFETLQRGDDGKLILGPPKSRSSRRSLPLVRIIETRFRVLWAEHLAAAHADEKVVSCDHLVFTNTVGKPIDPKRDWQQWHDLLDAAGVPHRQPHAARNTSASLLAAAGVPQGVVKEILGHSTITLTADVYTKADSDQHRKALEQLETYVAGE